MQSFKDRKGRKWIIDLTLAKVRKLREVLGLDLLNPSHISQVWGSLTDQLTFVFLLVEAEAKAEGIDADEFERRLQGDGVATEASVAFLNELAVFFRKYDQEAMAKITDKQIQTRRESKLFTDELIKSGRFDSAMNQVLKEMERQLVPPVGNTSENSVQSSDGNLGQT